MFRAVRESWALLSTATDNIRLESRNYGGWVVRAYQRGVPEECGHEPGNGGFAPGPEPEARPPA